MGIMLEIRVPISPRPYFFRQVECLYRSAKSCGGLTGQVRMVVSVGEDMEPYDIAATMPWSDENVVWRWVAREDFRRLHYHGTGLDRFKYDSDASVVAFLDADTLFVNGVDDLLASLAVTPAIAGVMAHIPPFPDHSADTWETLFHRLGRRLPPDLHQHTGWGTMMHRPDRQFAPVYYNFGAVFISSGLLPALSGIFPQALDMAEQADVGYYRSQVALTLGIYELDLPRITLSPRYNFPNDPLFEFAYPGDLRDLRILHYLRLDEVQRDAIWETPEATAEFIRRSGLRPSNQMLQRTVAKLFPL